MKPLAASGPTPMGKAFDYAKEFESLDFAALKDAASKTGGEFFTARSDKDLGEVYARIDALEKTELEDPRYRFVDGFAWPLAIGLGTLVLALLLDVLWIRGVP